jgi:hypothetical protein
MMEPVLVCPTCHTEIKLTESLAAPIVASVKQEYEKKIAEKDFEVSRREATLREQAKEVATARAQVDAAVEEGIRRERQKIAAEELKKARLLVSDELDAKSRNLADLEQVIAAKDEKLAEAQKVQAELLRKERELDDAKREIDLTIEQRVQASLGSVREKAKRDVEAELNLKVTEREETIAGLQRQIEVLKQKAEQGSQQLQGEAQELELEIQLTQKFPMDQVDSVPKGQFGGDIIQRVQSASGQICGTILWESKRTRNWSDGWLPKLRNDQRAAKADIAILVSRALPGEIESFDFVDGIWIVAPRCAIPVAIALRRSLIDIANARQVNEGRLTKMEVMYAYLTGPRFRMHVQAIVEKFTAMEGDLASERRSMARIWAKREGQIQGAIESTAMLYGDLQGIAGRSLQEIEGLEHPMLQASTREA